MSNFICYACSQETPDAFKHEHHKVPLAAGGTDKDLVSICASCHTSTHSIAYMVLNPKRTHEIDETLLYYKSADTRKKIAELAYTVAREMTLKSEAGTKNLEAEEKTVTFTTDKQQYLKILFAAKDRRMSVANFVKMVVLQQVEKLL